MTFLEIVVAGFALWRVSALFSYEKGPANIFVKFRELIGIHSDDAGDIVGIEDRWLPKLFSCVWCLSMLVSLFYIPLWFFFKNIMFWISLPFAVSAIAVILEVKLHE